MNCSEEFFDAYIECALWSSTDESRDDGGDPLDDNYGPEDIQENSLRAMRAECDDFCASHAELLSQLPSNDAQNGYDFWLTRNGHGTGFWDRGYGAAGDVISDACEPYGPVDLYVGDNGVVYASGYEGGA